MRLALDLEPHSGAVGRQIVIALREEGGREYSSRKMRPQPRRALIWLLSLAMAMTACPRWRAGCHGIRGQKGGSSFRQPGNKVNLFVEPLLHRASAARAPLVGQEPAFPRLCAAVRQRRVVRTQRDRRLPPTGPLVLRGHFPARFRRDAPRTGNAFTAPEPHLALRQQTHALFAAAQESNENETQKYAEQQIQQFVAQTRAERQETADPNRGARRTRARASSRAQVRGLQSSSDLAVDDSHDDGAVSLSKLIRRCERRVRGGGSVRSAEKTLSAALADLEREGASKSADYDLIVHFCLRSWSAEGDAQQGLVAALDLVAEALSYGHAPSVRTFNAIMEAFLSSGNPDLPFPSPTYSEAVCRATDGRGRRKPLVKALEALGAVYGRREGDGELGHLRSMRVLDVMQAKSELLPPHPPICVAGAS